LESCLLQDFGLLMNRARSSTFDRTEAKKRTPLPKVDPFGESCHSQIEIHHAQKFLRNITHIDDHAMLICMPAIYVYLYFFWICRESSNIKNL